MGWSAPFTLLMILMEITSVVTRKKKKLNHGETMEPVLLAEWMDDEEDDSYVEDSGEDNNFSIIGEEYVYRPLGHFMLNALQMMLKLLMEWLGVTN